MKAPTRRRRAGATETIGVSLDPATKKKLKALAEEKFGGNVSALIADMTEEAVQRAARDAAFERAWALYGGPEPTPEEMAAIDAELQEAWAHARKYAAQQEKRPKKKRAKREAA